MTDTAQKLSGQSGGRAIFVGSRGYDAAARAVPEMLYSYMTALQMQAKVTALTGYEHPDFATYADILGRDDPQTGSRTNSSPTLLSVLLIQRIAADVAGLVCEREEFLSDSERLVFTGIDLSSAPTAAALADFLTGLYRRWLNVSLANSSLQLLVDLFRATVSVQGPAAAYQAVLGLLLEHGGLYYS